MIAMAAGALVKLVRALGFREVVILMLLVLIGGIVTGTLPNQLNEVVVIKQAVAAHARQNTALIDEQLRILRLICLFTAQHAAGRDTATVCFSPPERP